MANRAGLNFISWDTPEEWAQLQEDVVQLVNSADQLQAVLEFRQKRQNKQIHLSEYEKVEQQCHSRDTVLIARYSSSVAALLAAEQLKVPLISVFTAPSFVTQMPLDEELFGDIWATDINSIRAEIGLAPVRSWISWISSPKRTIGLWPEWFAAPASGWPVQVLPVGFPLERTVKIDDLPREVYEFLDQGEPPILIAGGSSNFVKAEIYSAGAEACRLLERRGILVTQYKDVVPDQLSAKVRWFKYLPFEKLMPHMAAVIHHGGIGTLSQAIAAGIPQVVLAHGFDRPDNAVRLKQLGIGEGIPLVQWKPDILAEAIGRVTKPATQKRCRDLANRIRHSYFETIIGEVVEEVVSNEDFLLSSENFLADSAAAAQSNSQDIATRTEAVDSKKADLLKSMDDISSERRVLLAQLLRQKKSGMPSGKKS
jgi:UDP:flavonoid glycosyltransferase YjiC (YdhE family)